jgi:two-component system phosphate regulon sensor histidine kinase PhoR
MWHSGLFWRRFTLCGVVWLALVGLLALVEGRVEDHRWLVWTSAAVAGLVVLLIAVGLAQRISHPLKDLTRAAERIGEGNFGHRVYASRRDEVARLADSFNHMSERLGDQFAQLQEDRQQLRTILSGMVEGVIALDAGQRILYANERAAQLLELQSAGAVGRKLWEVVRLRSLQEVVRAALAGPAPARAELTLESPQRSLTVHAARLPGDPPRGAVLVLHDTSDLRRLERLRQEFVANVSHELKTPLAVIKACVETLMDGAAEDPDHRGKFLEQIDSQADRLHALILDLLTLARIESGEEAFELRPIAVEPVVAACLKRHQARAEAKQQVLKAIPPGTEIAQPRDQEEAAYRDAEGARQAGLPVSNSRTLAVSPSDADLAVWADEEALCEILDNLVDNAVKYTPEGGRIAVRWYADDGHVNLEVADSGIGIPETDLPRVFERFYRVDKARSREMGGTGLGLSIVKHLVQALHGSVEAVSTLGKGTTFTVRLPRSPE